MGSLPINFETKIKEPKALNGGYPYSIKAEDLMKNYVDAKLEVDTNIHSSGLQLEEYLAWGDNGHPGRAIRLTGEVVGGAIHPFRVTVNAEDPEKVDIYPGTVYHESGEWFVSGQVGLTALDLFFVRITRDESTRAVTNATIVTRALDNTPVSGQQYQYVHIATLASGEITRHWFHDISVFEDLAVVNGVFKLVPLAMVGPNFYNAP